MRKPYRAMLLLGLAIITADAINYQVWLSTHSKGSDLIREALWSSQNGLLWIWACLGLTRASIRVSAALIGTMFFVLMVAFPEGYPRSVATSARLFADAAGIILILGGARLSGWRLVMADSAPLFAPRRRFQFSLRSAMEAITGLAILMALARVAYSQPVPDSLKLYLQYAAPWFVVEGLIYAIIASLAFWASFGLRRTVLRWNGLSFGVFAAWFFLGGPKNSLEVSGALVDVRMHHGIPLQALLIVGSLALCRSHGYRFVRTGRSHESQYSTHGVQSLPDD
jgi:hypothetical protein